MFDFYSNFNSLGEPIINPQARKKESSSSGGGGGGYTRKDAELLSSEVRLLHESNEQLIGENYQLKEECDALRVRVEERAEQAERLRVQLSMANASVERETSRMREAHASETSARDSKVREANEQLGVARQKLAECETRRERAVAERDNYVQLCTKLSAENKRLFKKWSHIRRNDNKFRLLLVEQMKRYTLAKQKRKVCRLATQTISAPSSASATLPSKAASTHKQHQQQQQRRSRQPFLLSLVSAGGNSGGGGCGGDERRVATGTRHKSPGLNTTTATTKSNGVCFFFLFLRSK